MMLHSPPLRLDFQEDLIATLESLRDEGKILRFGISTETIEGDIRPYLSGAVYQFPLTGPSARIIDYASKLKKDSSLRIARESFRYCREQGSQFAVFDELSSELGNDFHDAALAACLRAFPLDVLLVGMTRPETAIRNATFFERIPEGLLALNDMA